MKINGVNSDSEEKPILATAPFDLFLSDEDDNVADAEMVDD